ncbi:MAG TPA: GNAT family protein [Thermoplasmata archaeon]|nr:GNAT family protein [Thermoplasmata archaeon]
MLPELAFRHRGVMEGRFLRLEPLEERHAAALVGVAADPEVFRHLRYGPLDTAERMAEHIRQLNARRDAGTDLPFAMVRRADGVPIGMTRYLEIDRANAGVEVGGTWMPKALWGTIVNPESKRLMLGRAFDDEGAIRVQIKTDLRNLRSQRAIEKLGAVREGVLRDQVIMPDGYIRSSVYYSILRREWPMVRERLDRRIQAAPLPEGPDPPRG